MIPFRFSREARSEYLAAAGTYGSKQAGLGKRFVEAVEDSISRVRQHPLLYKLIEANVRRCRVARFPYALLYHERLGTIEIVAVMHLHREPGYWRERIR